MPRLLLDADETHPMTESNDAKIAERIVQRGADEWRVREVSALNVPGARGPRCLICESGDVVRRLWKYPADWQELDDDALWELCDGVLT